MRFLVIGTLPPPGGKSARELASLASALINQGHDVEILSPDVRSAAHRHGFLGGFGLAIYVGYLAPRFDALVLHIETGLPLKSNASRSMRAVSLFGLGLALSRWKDVTIRLDHPVALPRGLGGRSTKAVWHAASRIVVRDEQDLTALCLVPGVRRDAVVLEKQLPLEPIEIETSFELNDVLDRNEVLELIRKRSVEVRARNAALIDLQRVGPDRAPRATLLSEGRVALNPGGIVLLAVTKLRRRLTR